MSELFGAMCSPVSPAECLEILAWIEGQGAAPAALAHCRWLLAHCDDGVCWGEWDGNRWRLASEFFPEMAPAVTARNVQQVRLFGGPGGGGPAEWFLWRAEPDWAGRVLREQSQAGLEDWAVPKEENRILLGDRTLGPARGQFTPVADGTGAQQVIPPALAAARFQNDRWPLRLTVRHYFERDPESGAVRIAASRLVKIFAV